MPDDIGNLDLTMRRALTRCLPEHEPAIGVDLEEVLRRGRRRFHTRRIVPVAAAVITVLAIAVPWSLHRPAPPEPPPVLGTGPATATSTEPTGPRIPAGHRRDTDADTLTTYAVQNRLPAGRIVEHFGTRSDEFDGGGRYGYGFHMLWAEGGRYGYLIGLHRTRGAYPATAYGLPAEPCAEPGTRLPQYNCAPFEAPAGDLATSFELAEQGYRMRGLIWEKQDPAGGAPIRVTGIFYLPAPGAPTPFPALDTAPRLESFPLTVADIARAFGMEI
ncbi:MAG TPA: hypothetical protein VFV67_12245 [Actinophytocola sp.]|uniref:hypothetical protein n=1 Tax=Actinophytocola sp. TaxID=1872138 RepID=UPI002DBC299B|nr:hypothetical protein [Actinophytocola sp.]HEU5471416.1 hypothetical protein [Actinophytocola sp.]